MVLVIRSIKYKNRYDRHSYTTSAVYYSYKNKKYDENKF